MVANRNIYNTKYIRLLYLPVEITTVRDDEVCWEHMKKLKKTKLLLLDEWLPCPLKESEAKDVLEFIGARAKIVSTIFFSQFDIPCWPENLSDPLLPDATSNQITKCPVPWSLT